MSVVKYKCQQSNQNHENLDLTPHKLKNKQSEQIFSTQIQISGFPAIAKLQHFNTCYYTPLQTY